MCGPRRGSAAGLLRPQERGPPLDFSIVEHTAVGIFSLTDPEVAPYLPPGFTPVATNCANPEASGNPLCPDAPGPPVLQLLGTSFTWAANPAGASNVESMVVSWIYANPPDQYESADRGEWGTTPWPYMVVPQIVVSSAALVAEFDALGLPAELAAITHDVSIDGLGNQISLMTVDSATADWTLEVTIDPATFEPTPTGPGFLRFFGAESRVLDGIVDFDEDPHFHSEDSPPSGSAVFTVISGTPGFPFRALPLEGLGIQTQPGYEISLSAVPEPGSAAPLGLGLVALGVRRRR